MEKGNKVRFWENNWLGTSSLAIQFWRLYVIVNEKSGMLGSFGTAKMLDLSFVGDSLMNQCLEVIQLASTIVKHRK